MVDILNQLKGSDEPGKDRRDFLKAQILFWILAATDGHAKNFSVFLLLGGRFRMTPLYDVISVHPAIDAGQLQRQRVKLAMSVGSNRHFLIHHILPRHFAQTAERAGVGKALVAEICHEITERFDAAWDEAISTLPAGFPDELVASLRNGMQVRLHLLEAV